MSLAITLFLPSLILVNNNRIVLASACGLASIRTSRTMGFDSLVELNVHGLGKIAFLRMPISLPISAADP